jgi:hypothetical protein
LHGNLQVLRRARLRGFPWDASTRSNAAFGGHLEVLQWLRANRCPWDEWTCTHAARNGHLNVLQWACENGCPWNADGIMDEIDGRFPEMMEWVQQNR